jgi:chromosome segregation ATPase
MKQFKVLTTLTFRLMVVAIAAASYGCASSPTAKETSDSMSALGNELAKAKDTLDSTTRSLEKLTASQASDIPGNLDAYTKSVQSLDSQASTIKRLADEMKADGDVFFKEWKGADKVTPERRAALSASYAKLKESMASTRDSFAPLLASLKDVQSYVSLDPTLKGIQSMSPMVKKANDNSAKVKAQVDALMKELNGIRGML